MKWLIYAQAEQHFNSYIERLRENGGDLWDMLESVFDRGMDLMERAGLINMHICRSEAYGYGVCNTQKLPLSPPHHGKSA